MPSFDAIVIGAGPAGLSAARTAARLGLRTVVLERLAQAGELAHPCGAAMSPVPGFVSGRWEDGGIHYPELNLTLPASFVVGTPTSMRYVSPGGHEIRATFPSGERFPIAVVDKPALLRLLAEQAQAAGAELRFGVRVTGLLEEGSRIAGVRTSAGELRAPVTLSAEGINRRLTEAAGLYADAPPVRRYAFIASEDLEAPAARAEDVDQVITLGRRYTSAGAPGVGTLLIPTAGRATVYFSIFSSQPRLQADQPLEFYLNEYKERDPRVREFLAGARVLRRAGCRIVVRAAPKRVVRDGFMGLGDSVIPGGQSGIVTAMFLGQEAARVAAQAVRAGDTSTAGLAPYDRLFHGPILRGVETEGAIMMALTDMSDDEIDRVCQTMSTMNMEPFFFGETGPIVRETLRWTVREFPRIVRDWRLIRRMF